MTHIDSRPGWEAVIIPETDEHAGVYLVKHLATDKLFRYCRRCGGQGEYSFNLMDGTVCYGCSGRGYAEQTTLDDELRKAKARKRAAARRKLKAEAEAEIKAEALDRWRTEHEALVYLLEAYAGQDDFLADLLANLPLTERQVDAANAAIQRLRIQLDEQAARQQLGHLDAPVGSKVTLEVEITKAPRYFPAERFDRSGQYLVTMRDVEHGRVFKTWTSGSFGDDVAEAMAQGSGTLRWKITGTVKEHGEYNDTPETTLNRVKRVEAP